VSHAGNISGEAGPNKIKNEKYSKSGGKHESGEKSKVKKEQKQTRESRWHRY